jgi:leucine dehydrogenase
MSIFEKVCENNHEQIIFCQDKNTGLKAIIAIHNTKLGPALGGCRFYPYATEEDALFDVLRLSRGMSYKAAVAGLNLGGGKSVIIGDPKKLGTEALFRAFGRFVATLGGRYITAEDVGTNTRTMEWAYSAATIDKPFIVGIPAYLGGSGDPSPVTAHGTFVGIKSALKKVKGNDGLKGVKVAVEGIGNVGYHLCKELHQEGAKLFVSDVNADAVNRAVKEFGATAMDVAAIYGADVDVYAPCALGATVNDKTIPQFKCKIIAGAANNQLLVEAKHGMELKNRGILYAPDYVINAGGLINVSTEVYGGGAESAWHKTEEIYNTLLNIYAVAEKENISTAEASKHIAEKRINDVSQTNHIYVGE